MKPLSLKLKNIGAFAGEAQIDFTQLNEIFLICGKTGSGKTTILDSICYALYGKLTGVRSDHLRMMRSQYVADGEESSVMFEFLLAGVEYRVLRILPQSYENRNKKLAEKSETVKLFKCETGKYKEIPGKKTEIDEKIKNLIGLSLEEFSKIVLLPQGEFAAFLQLNSNEREQALSKLFPVDDYKAITELAVNKSKFYRQELSAIENQIAMFKTDYDEQTAGENLQNLVDEEKQLNEQNDLLRQELMTESAAFERADHLKRQIEDFEENKKKLAGFEQEKEQIEEKRRRVLKAHLAETVKPYYDNVRLSEQKLQQNSTALAEKKEQLEQVKNERQQLDAQKQTIAELKEHNPVLSLQIHSLEQARELVHKEQELQNAFEHETSLQCEKKDNLQRLAQTFATAEDEVQRIKDSVSPENLELLLSADNEADRALQTAKEQDKQFKSYSVTSSRLGEVEDSLQKHGQKVAELQKQITMLRQETEMLEKQKQFEQQNQAAVVLAKQLEEGKPCPVCGSIHHPSPAAMLSSLTSDELIAAKKQLLEGVTQDNAETEKKISSLLAQKESLQEALKDMPQFVDFDPAAELAKAAAKRQQTKNAYDEAKRLSNSLGQKEKSLFQLKNTIDAVKDELAQLAATIQGIMSQKQAVSEQLSSLLKNSGVAGCDTSGIVDEQIQSLKSQFEANENTINNYEMQLSENQKQCAAFEGEYGSLGRQQQLFALEAENCKSELSAKLAETAFDSVDEMLDCCLEPQISGTLSAEVEEWDSEYTAVKALVSSVPAGIADAVVPDTTQIEQNIENIKQRMSILNDRLQAVAAQKQSLADKASGLAKLEEQRRQLSQESQYYCKLADDLSGKNPLGLRFESWILGVYLEEVTIFASRRLERISDGRYRLLLKTSPGSGRQRYSGLDLEIFDAYTGKKRPCETLSGGETFLASLSLALALTDVVQSKSGGIQLDSLFIDEGFGSLDDAALEKALSILDEIRETRMIGLISHVGELESRISSRIEVIKSQNGSRISIKRN